MARRADEIGTDILIGRRIDTSGHGNVRWGGFRPPVRSGDLMPTVVTKQDARATLDRARDYITALGNEIKASKDVPAEFRARWISFEFQWIGYYATASKEVDSAILGLNAKSIIERTEEYEGRAKLYQAEFRKLGNPSTVEPPPEPPKSEIPSIAIGTGIGAVGALAAVLIGVLFLKR